MAHFSRLSRLLYFFTVKPHKFLVRKAQTPRKSALQFGLGGYLAYYVFNLAYADAMAYEKVRAYVESVAKIGSRISIESERDDYHVAPLKKILVILNPASSGGSSGKYFGNIIQPILDVSGFDVHYHRTTGVKNARDVAETMLADKFDALIIVGGDGTVSEVMTGLMWHPESEGILSSTPIGIIPTGLHNQTYKNLVKNNSNLDFDQASSDERADFIINETARILSALSSNTKSKSTLPQKCSHESLMEIRMTRKSDTPEQAQNRRPTYALNSLEWGLKREIPFQKDKYWFIVPFKERVARFKLASDKIQRKVNCDVQFDKATEKTMQSASSSTNKNKFVRSSRLIESEIDRDDLLGHDYTAENFEIKIRPEDRKKLIMVPRNNLGSSFDFAMSPAFLREFRGNRPNFHRIKMRQFENSEQIFVDGNDYDLNDVDNIEVRMKQGQFFMIQ